MITIILYGNLDDKKITKLLISNLESLYNIIYATPYKITRYQVKNLTDDILIQDILIIETDLLSFVETTDTILIFKNNISKEINLLIQNNINIIVFSQNIKAIEFLNKSKLPNIITFGYKATDSLTSSSFGTNIDEDQKTICLQRQVKSTTGKMIEPFEFTITEKSDILDLLPVYGVKILLAP